MRRVAVAPCVLVLILLHLLANGAAQASGETLFVYLEETPNSVGLYEMPVREGLMSGLFERDHVVFDDVRPAYNVNWQSHGFKQLINSAADGGASILVAVKVTYRFTPLRDELKTIDGTARFYCYEVEEERLISHGTVRSDNAGREQEVDREGLGILLGEELSVEIDRVCAQRRVLRP